MCPEFFGKMHGLLDLYADYLISSFGPTKFNKPRPTGSRPAAGWSESIAQSRIPRPRLSLITGTLGDAWIKDLDKLHALRSLCRRRRRSKPNLAA